MVSTFTLSIAVLVYLMAVFYLSWYGYKRTREVEDFMVAGRKAHPFVVALSYGTTFISTSAIVGFGGVAGLFGMGLLWLTFLNIFVGIFIAFVLFGTRTRRMGKNIGAITFPELLGKRFKSRFIQGFSGVLIFLFMPLYAGIVLIGAARFIEVTLNIDYNIALLIFVVIIAAYVITGGLIAVMYTEALQGTIMFVGMLLLLIFTYVILGGVSGAHQGLTELAALAPASLTAGGFNGWTAFPTLGSPIWWTLVSTIVLGVGIGVLAQPQLAVRFMTTASDRSLYKATAIGGVFILMMTGVAFIVGALSNLYFYRTEGLISVAAAGGNIDKIIPMYITSAMPDFFVVIFMLTLLAAAMSTLASQFHVMGTAIGHDFYREFIRKGKIGFTVPLTRLGIMFTILLSVILAYTLPISIIARATAIFMGLCAAAFLPMYIGALFWKKMSREGAVASLLVGTVSSLFWLTFVHAKEATALGICKGIFGVDTLLTGTWTVVDPIVVALPISLVVAFAVSLFTKPMDDSHLAECFKGIKKVV